ncbi:hypothetical protein HOP50_12g67760 [Chloropicon primus]|uniref:Uncharacterized protein n=2 Tax=Chloropicon primus TaxID=1764295 RepID=A0A5B8MXN1_9CHLO|nr:hypothetical protein A3770_12p67580 [Chloropicon primus]UPR03447.1 hypothetical protein HOP50_12g67760 [Chloropicon primus]|eukprot:QDZ24240.1 hypothetical protein A3770_12p67580 [Chloropicon primus]
MMRLSARSLRQLGGAYPKLCRGHQGNALYHAAQASRSLGTNVDEEERRGGGGGLWTRNRVAELAPGVGASFGVMTAGYETAEFLGQGLLSLQGVESSVNPISGIPCSILLGLAIKNVLPLEALGGKVLAPGIKFSSKALLQLGIVCVGAKLSAADLVSTGVIGIPAVVASITSGLLFVPWLGNKLGLPHKMSTLIACGTSICGVTAISALSPAIRATERETSFAIANVVAFGTIGMLAYPYLAHHILPTTHQIGMFLGLAVHDTSQAIGSALTYSSVYGSEEVVKVTAITKLSRNLCLAAVIPGLTYTTARRERREREAEHSGGLAASAGEDAGSLLPTLEGLKKYVPGFVVGFVAMSILRSAGDFTLDHYGLALGLVDGSQWKELTSVVGSDLGSHYLLGTAMAAVGLSTSTSNLRGVGYKPFVVGLAGAGVVGTTGFASTMLLGNLFL